MSTTRRLALAAITLCASLGCGANRDASPRNEPIHNEPPHRDDASARRRLELVAQAERALSTRWPLDYRRPFVIQPEDETAANLYLEACREGDKPSCWIAATMDGSGIGRATPRVLENCRAGDVMSCRALPSHLDFGDAPGREGRSERCWGVPEKTCDLSALRRECEAGFAFSCWWMFQAPPPDKGLAAHALPLARAGCRASIENECRMLWSSGDAGAADQKLSDDHLCPLRIGECSAALTRYLKLGDFGRARDVAEQLCQYGGDQSHYNCLTLGEYYVSGTLPEPVHGRGEALISWACTKESFRELAPTCKARAKQQVTLPKSN
ncbi:MAG: hypothetical protein ABIY55_17020 [Kofleriaceae bacterium]